MESKFLDNINNILTYVIVVSLFLSGGVPISPIIFKALESHYNVKLPTYNIGKLMYAIDNLNEVTSHQTLLNASKMLIDNPNKFLDLLDTKEIRYTPIISKENRVAKIRIETTQEVNKLKSLLSSISTDNDISINTSFLNEQEAIVSINY